MRKLYLTAVMALMPALFFAQNIFEKYEKDENVTSFIAGKKTFSMIAKTNLKSDDQRIRNSKEFLSDIDGIYVYTTESQSVGADMKSTVGAYVKSNKLEELLQVNDSGKRVSIMVKEGRSENIVTQFLVFISNDKPKMKGNESIIVLVTGNFNLDDLSEMISDKSVTGDKKTDEKKFAEIKNALELKVSPNPATGVFYINTDKAVDVKMYDLSGRMVKQQTYSSAGIPVSDLTPATYLVEISSGDMRQTQKIVIK